MPFSFPSHQGLIAPLWRRWPQHFDTAALCVGAAMPDVVDGVIGLFRGHLGQSLGHSLFGLAVFCVPGGLVLWWLMHAAAKPCRPLAGAHFLARAWNAFIAHMHANPAREALREHALRVVVSLAIGGFSHLFIDLISHGGFPWFRPWIHGVRIFPDWWYIAWMRVPLPGYQNAYPIGPHFLVWATLSLLGTYLLFKPVLKKPPED